MNRSLIPAALAALALSACSTHTCPPPPEPPAPIINCLPIELDALAEGADSILDYRGDLDAWVTNDPGETPRYLGFAAAEDSLIFTDANCV